MQTYTVFYAKSPMMMLNMDAPVVAFKDQYTQVAELPGVFGKDFNYNLEVIFDKMNVVHGDEIPAKLGIRSMCVGDIVVTKGEAWYVCGTGWKQVNFV